MALPYDAERVGQQREQCAHDKEIMPGHVCRGAFANDGRFLRWPLPILGGVGKHMGSSSGAA
jgi:hypothetical protein